MTSVDFRKHLILKQRLEDFLRPYITIKGDINVNPLESWVFITHYKFVVGILLCLFTGVVSSWFALTPMECYLKYDRSEVPEFQEDICLSYPYSYSSPRDSYLIKREKIYALHYRWVHWVILLLVPLYNSVLWLRMELDHKILNRVLKQMECDKNNRKQLITCLVDDIVAFSTGQIYVYKLLLHFYCLMVDIVAFAFLDVSLQNRFARLFPLDYPFTRWPQHFNDTVSLAFPHFVECNVGKEILLMLDMEDKLGCRLQLMIIYDKLFILMWVCMVLLTAWSIVSLFHCILLGVSKCLKRNLIEKDGCCKKNSRCCLEWLSTGDLLVMDCLSNLVSGQEYRSILDKIVRIIRNFEENAIVFLDEIV